MNTKHILIILAGLSAFGELARKLNHWGQLSEPETAGALIVAVVAAVAALLTTPPRMAAAKSSGEGEEPTDRSL